MSLFKNHYVFNGRSWRGLGVILAWSWGDLGVILEWYGRSCANEGTTTNEENKHSSNQTIKHTNKQWNKQSNKQTINQTNKRTIKQTNTQSNKLNRRVNSWAVSSESERVYAPNNALFALCGNMCSPCVAIWRCVRCRRIVIDTCIDEWTSTPAHQHISTSAHQR